MAVKARDRFNAPLSNSPGSKGKYMQTAKTTKTKGSMLSRFWNALVSYSEQRAQFRMARDPRLTHAKSLADLELAQRRSAGTL
jgi:hypothetical protein